jgi:hypothetical protein
VKPKKSRTRPHDRRTFTPGVDRLEPRISLSHVDPTGHSGHVTALGVWVNHNETLVRARRPRKRNGVGRKDRRPLAQAVEGLERRVSLSCVGLTGSMTGAVRVPPPPGTTLNHNETLVRAPRHRCC